MTIAGFEFIEYDVADGVASVALNSPGTRNALWFGACSIREELTEALKCADRDDAVGSILVSGNGASFCGGADLRRTAPRETALEQARFFEQSARFLDAVRRTAKPTIGAVHGHCLGAGMGLIAQLDLVVAACDARFGLSEGVYGWPGATDLVPVIGPAWAKFLIFTGETIDAATAREIGLVFELVEPGSLTEATQALARRIADAPRPSAQLNKRGVNAVVDALGRSAALKAGQLADALTAGMGNSARAPDGRPFREIIAQEGVSGLRKVVERPSWRERWAVGVPRPEERP